MHLSIEGILEGYRLNLRAGNNFSHIVTYDSDLQVTRGWGDGAGGGGIVYLSRRLRKQMNKLFLQRI